MKTKERVLALLHKGFNAFNESETGTGGLVELVEDEIYLGISRNQDRIAKWVVALPNTTCDSDVPGYGEGDLLPIFLQWIKEEDEQWIVDTDVLNWNIKVGATRDFSELREIIRDLDWSMLKFSEIQGKINHTHIKYPYDMWIFMTIELNDYMS